METAFTTSSVVCKTGNGTELHSTLLRFSRRQVVVEIYDPHIVLRMSEVLEEVKICVNGRQLYSGKAVIRNLVNTGSTMICEATLEETWSDEDFLPGENAAENFREFFRKWQTHYKVSPEYKILIADIQTFLIDLRLWLEHVELKMDSGENRLQFERKTIAELAPSVIKVIDNFFGKFETMFNNLEESTRPLHRAYMKRLLHSLVLCSPFAYRTFQKPLDYAGDYEMVNMMMRETEGNSLFAKIINLWFLQQPPAEAHRNRVIYLEKKLVEETARVSLQNRPMEAFNLGCGPAWEIQKFLTEREICNRAQFTLLDFNEETLLHTRETLEGIKNKYGRTTPIQFVKKSVQQVVKDGTRVAPNSPHYDLVYCAGLFDYLSDQVCLRLMNIFYESVKPGGLLLVTNVDVYNPLRNTMETLLDWHLIYRTSQQARKLIPEKAHPDDFSVKSDITGVNIFIEVRKPNVP